MRGEIIKELLRPRSDSETVRVGFFMLKDFSLLAFSAAVEPLRAANRLSEKPLFSWVTTHISIDIWVVTQLNSGFSLNRFAARSGSTAAEKASNEKSFNIKNPTLTVSESERGLNSSLIISPLNKNLLVAS